MVHSSNWEACRNASWNTPFPPGPPAKLRPFLLQVAFSGNVTARGVQAPQHGKVLLLASLIGTEQLIRTHVIIFLSLLPSPLNVIATEQQLALQWAPMLFIQCPEDLNSFFQRQQKEDYTSIGLGEKMVTPVGIGSMTVTGPATCALETPLSLWTASKHGLDKDRSFWPPQLVQTWLETQAI